MRASESRAAPCVRIQAPLRSRGLEVAIPEGEIGPRLGYYQEAAGRAGRSSLPGASSENGLSQNRDAGLAFRPRLGPRLRGVPFSCRAVKPGFIAPTTLQGFGTQGQHGDYSAAPLRSVRQDKPGKSSERKEFTM